MKLGYWKARMQRIQSYYGYAMPVMTVLILANIEVPIYISVPALVIPIALFVWKLDLGKIFPEENDYNAKKTPIIMELCQDVKETRKDLEKIKRELGIE